MASIPRFRRIAVLVSIAVAVLAYPPAAQDTVTLDNTSGSSYGVLVSGQLNGAHAAFNGYQGSSSTVSIGNFSNSPSTNEIVAFTNRHPPAITTPAWTAGANSIDVSFTPEIAIPVTVWVLKGPFAAGKQRALDLHGAVTQIWIEERMGVAFQQFDIRDATDSKFRQFLSFKCSKRSRLETAIQPVAGQINIYLVDTVDGGTGKGQACGVGGTLGGKMVAVGSSAPTDLLAHEIGHNFGLSDLYSADGFDATNAMYKSSSTRRYFTEGQIFRAHMGPSSSLNILYHARPGQLRRCEDGDNNDQCPPLNKRIWADGSSYPPN